MLQSSDHAILLSEADRLRATSVATLLDQNSDRVSQLTVTGAGLTLDASKQLIDEQALEALAASAAGADLAGDSSRALKSTSPKSALPCTHCCAGRLTMHCPRWPRK
jgi:hypothetical protein